MKEDDFQAAQVNMLTARRDFTKDLWFCAIPNAAKRSYKLAAYMRKTGLVTGAPDLIVWMPGRVIHIENKVHGNKTTDAQDWFHEGLRALGHEVHVITAKTADDAVRQLEELLKED
jgi:hypothetical protein